MALSSQAGSLKTALIQQQDYQCKPSQYQAKTYSK